ncbi:MAG: hypothetical protein Unbinned657contig1001_48 [Prokaryotic dsDNA virus sp.]|nr:MAG: hypothetical protein Unbinned657contig1001_48 [Prokaryotic dsDNA virus sp.]|tara:strand:- start:4105 stop:5280 length:1176 start_codon:yes stop_codon:yes gene_type:complete
MNYIGTDPREGLKIIASSDISSATSSVTYDSIFDTNSMYFTEVAHYLGSKDIGGIGYTYRNGGSDDNGTHNRSTQYVSVNSSRYANSDVNTTDNYSWGTFLAGHGGGEDELETGGFSTFFVPKTTNEKYMWGESIGWYPVGEALMLQMNTSYSDATAMDGIKFNDTQASATMNQANIRIYKYPETTPSVLSLKQTLPSVNYVKPKYIGQIRSGKGMVEVGKYTSVGGESSIDFTDIFTSAYDRYYFYLTNCRPATDDKNLQMFWIQTDGTVESTTSDYWKGYRKMDANGTSSTALTNNQNNPNIMYNVGSDNDECGHLYAWCDNPNSANLGKQIRFRSIHQRSSVTGRNEMTRFMAGQMLFDETTAMGGVRFAWSSGNWEEGTITILGLQR